MPFHPIPPSHFCDSTASSTHSPPPQDLRNAEHSNLYNFLIFGVGGLWGVTCCRAYVHVPDTPRSRLFVVVYDSLLAPFCLLNVGLMVCNYLGFHNNYFYSVMLLDIMNNSVMLGKLAEAFVAPAPKIALVLYVLACSSMVYAQFGLHHFEAAGNWGSCRSAMACFWEILYRGVPSKKIFSYGMVRPSGADEGGPAYLLRVLFDVAWFFWGFVMSKVLTGLILSSFTKLRLAAAARRAQLDNVVFVTGIERSKYGDLGLENAPSFDELAKGTQGHWNYVSLVLHLMKKSPGDFSGCETFVAGCLANEDLKWLPAKTSYHIERAGKVYGGGKPGGGGGGGVGGVLAAAAVAQERSAEALARDVAGLRGSVAALGKRMDEAASGAGAGGAEGVE